MNDDAVVLPVESTSMKASIIIPTRDRWDTLARTLPSVLAQDCLGADVEILIVDDGSKNEPCEIVKESSRQGLVTLLKQERRGPAAARNFGLAVARGKVVLFLDDDIHCPSGLLSQHLAAHRQLDDLVSYGPIFLAPDSPKTLIAESTGNWYLEHWRRVSEQGGLIMLADTLLASNCAITRSVLTAMGGFDEAIPSKEDTELGIRLWKRDTPMHFLPDAVAHEMFVKSTHDHVARDGEAWGRAEIFICQRHPEFRRYSGLSNLGDSSRWVRFVRRVLVALPAIFHSWLFPLYLLTEKLRLQGRIRRAVDHVLALHSRVAFLRGASRQSGGWAALNAAFGSRLPILLYHHVGPSKPGVPVALTTSPADFERQVRWLAALGYRGICAADWASWCRAGTPLPSRSVMVTFDDAYADIAVHALPVLERHGFRATIFVVTREIGGSNSWDQPRGFAKLPLMNADEIREWAAKGFEFGAHSRTHCDLTQLANGPALEEIAGSSTDLQKILGRKVTSFAYPYGFHDDETRAAVGRVFESAITCDEGVNSLGTDLCLLRRTRVEPNDGFVDFAGRILFGWSPLNRLRTRIAVRRRINSLLGRFYGRTV